jgi:hypothetical protein
MFVWLSIEQRGARTKLLTLSNHYYIKVVDNKSAEKDTNPGSLRNTEHYKVTEGKVLTPETLVYCEKMC